MNKVIIIIVIIGIIIPIVAVAQLLLIDGDKHWHYIDGPDDKLTIKLHDDDQNGELGFSFWIKSNFTDSDSNGLWDDCETFNASVKGPDGNKTEKYIPLCENRNDEFKDIGLMKVGEACRSVETEDTDFTLPIKCRDGEYVITTNSEAQIRYDDEALGEVIVRGLLTVAGCCCGTLIVLLGIILAFTMDDGDNTNHSLLNNNQDDGFTTYEKKGWDEQEDYIRKDTSEDEITEKEDSEEKTKKDRSGEYELPPPPE